MGKKIFHLISKTKEIQSALKIQIVTTKIEIQNLAEIRKKIWKIL